MDNQSVSIKSRRDYKKVNLEIYHSLKGDYKTWIVIDISNKKQVLFTSNSHDECKEWINEEIIFINHKKLEGEYKYIFENGIEYYEGEWKNGKMDGYGIWEDPEYRDTYQGQWKNGKRHGVGTYKDYSSGKIITGRWIDGKINVENMIYCKEGGKVLVEGEILINNGLKRKN